MSELPDTIKHPRTFIDSPAAGFDGVFNWEWTKGCFGDGKITPMDFDGVVERKGNFIVFETKAAGVPIPKGQLLTLQRAHELGAFTIMLIHGKQQPEAVQIWCPPDFRDGRVMEEFKDVSVSQARGFVSRWYEYADKNPKQKVDVSFLHRRIKALETERDLLAEKIAIASGLIAKAIEVMAD